MDIKVYRPPSGQDQRYPKVERLKDDQQKKKKDDQQKKKKDEKLDSIFSSLADTFAHDDDNGY